jgi:acetoin utilization deacetylase AcuC-like enzyme
MIHTAFLADPIAKQHNPGPGHPEQPARWDAAVRGLGDNKLTEVAPRSATEAELELCHTAKYIGIARQDVERGAHSLSTGDTDIGPQSFAVALRAAGLCLDAVDLVMRGSAGNAFCIVRPPGHHASAARGMGFCLFNNIAIAARYAQRKYGVERVAIADWDVHHGNGTQDIFYADPSVFFFSTHQSPWYPGTGAASETGEGPGKGMTLNCPFPAGAGRQEILGAFTGQFARVWMNFVPSSFSFQPASIHAPETRWGVSSSAMTTLPI